MSLDTKLELTSSHKQFGGYTRFYTHSSQICQSPMKFAVYLPSAAEKKKLPVLYYLSGLTCSEEIFMTEAQAQAHAKKHEVILVVPDTSPRETGIPGEADSYDLGTGAGFYVDATQPKWSKHFQMYSYVTKELRELVESTLPIGSSRRGIFGHSMGGHGALVLGLRNPDLYRSISAFAPICAPSQAPWGIKAFTEYLGQNRADWAKYDALELIKKSSLNSSFNSSGMKTPMLIDQGLDDEFLPTELFTDAFENACRESGYPVTLRKQEGYDHSYFFISTFMEEHIAFHAKQLKS
jgi:S-formylglutathione hydrolase